MEQLSHRRIVVLVATIVALAVAQASADVIVRRVEQPIQQTFLQPEHFPTTDGDTAKAAAETTTGHTAVVDDVEGSGPDITAPGSALAPTIDGVVNVAEWSDALAMDITIMAQPVTMYLKHDGSFLYVAFVDQNDTTLDAFDQVGLYFDDEGGTPPILYDNLWTTAACPATEGNFWLGNFAPDPDDQFRGWIPGPTACTVQYGGTNVTVAYGVNGGFMNYEAAVDLASSALQAATGDTFGWRVYTSKGDGTFTGRWPDASVFNDPSTYGNLTLGYLGEALYCNGPAVEFEDGIPPTFDATHSINNVYWTTTDDPVGSGHSNETGGTGEAATADADALNNPPSPYDAELWTNGFSLAAASAASLDLQWRHRALNGSVFDVDVSDNGGSSWTNVVHSTASNPGGSSGDTANVDLTAWAGQPDVRLRYRFTGTGWDYYSQVDQLALSCTLPSISLTKTVGTTAGVCAATDTITVPAGTDVYYCYTTENTGNVALDLHDLEDSELGPILNGYALTLAPGASAEVIFGPVTITNSVTNSATWTAYNAGPADVAIATDDATVITPPPNDLCADAIELTCPAGGGTSSVLGSTTFATFTDQGTCTTSHSAPEVWYRVMGNGGNISVTTCSDLSNYDTKISVWSGACGALACVNGIDDDASCSFSTLLSTMSWASTPGVEYFVMVHGFSSAVGDFELTMDCDVPVELQRFAVE